MNVKISCQQINDTVLGSGKSSILFCVFVQFDNTVNDNVSVRTAFRIENIKEVWWNDIKQSEQLSVPPVCSCIFYQNRINSYIYYLYIYYLFLLFIFLYIPPPYTAGCIPSVYRTNWVDSDIAVERRACVLHPVRLCYCHQLCAMSSERMAAATQAGLQ